MRRDRTKIEELPLWVTEWLYKKVEWVDSGVPRRGRVVDVSRARRTNGRWYTLLRIVGEDGFVYPGVDELLATQL